jgi:hypothetical protein
MAHFFPEFFFFISFISLFYLPKLFIPFCTLFNLSKCIISTVGPYGNLLFHPFTLFFLMKMLYIIDSPNGEFFSEINFCFSFFTIKIYDVVSLVDKLNIYTLICY